MSGDRETQWKAVGAVIRERRLDQKRSQTEVASAAGITQAALSNYEMGKRGIPLETATRVFAFLGMPILLGVFPEQLEQDCSIAFILVGDECREVELSISSGD